MKYTEDYWKEISMVLEDVLDVEELFHKKICITGSSGMLCSPIVDVLHYLNRKKSAGIELLLAGRDIERIKMRFSHMKEGRDYRYIFFDATSSEDLDVEADFIIHGASNADPEKIRKYPVETMLANILGLNVVLKCAAKYKYTRVIYISSSEIYGEKKTNTPYTEEDYGYVDLLNPRASYPSSKRAAETLCASYAEEYGVNFVIVRPGHIYGPSIAKNDSRASAEFTRLVARHEDILMKSAGNQQRSYCYILDCASALLSIILHGKAGEAYNISNSASIVTIRELAEELARQGHVNVFFENSSEKEARGYNMMSNSCLGSDKLEKLGWKGRYGLYKGVLSTLKYY